MYKYLSEPIQIPQKHLGIQRFGANPEVFLSKLNKSPVVFVILHGQAVHSPLALPCPHGIEHGKDRSANVRNERELHRGQPRHTNSGNADFQAQ